MDTRLLPNSVKLGHMGRQLDGKSLRQLSTGSTLLLA